MLPPELSDDEVASRGQRWYDEQIKAEVEPDRVGEILFVDALTGGWVADRDAVKAAKLAHSRFPNGRFFCIRVGHRTAYRMGAASNLLSVSKQEFDVTLSTNDYVELEPAGALRVRGTRFSLDSVIHACEDGCGAEVIVISFPSLTLEQVHGAVAYYLRYRSQLLPYLNDQSRRWDELEQASNAANSDFRARIATRRAALAHQGSVR